MCLYFATWCSITLLKFKSHSRFLIQNPNRATDTSLRRVSMLVLLNKSTFFRVEFFEMICSFDIWFVFFKFKVFIIENVNDRFKSYVCTLSNSNAFPFIHNTTLFDFVVAVKWDFNQQEFLAIYKKWKGYKGYNHFVSDVDNKIIGPLAGTLTRLLN